MIELYRETLLCESEEGKEEKEVVTRPASDVFSSGMNATYTRKHREILRSSDMYKQDH